MNKTPAFARVQDTENMYMIGHNRSDFMKSHSPQLGHNHIMLFEVPSDRLTDVYSRVLLDLSARFEQRTLYGPMYFSGDRYDIMKVLAKHI
jgi:hypothetical protein